MFGNDKKKRKKEKKDSENKDLVHNVTVPYSPVAFHRFNDWLPMYSHCKAVPVTSLHLPYNPNRVISNVNKLI